MKKQKKIKIEKVEEVKAEETKVIQPVEIPKVETPKVESAEKIAFRAFIEKYKVSNPVKYELKKAVFENHLNSL